VGLKRTEDGLELVVTDGYRRTLVGLKRTVDLDADEPYSLQTDPCGVEADNDTERFSVLDGYRRTLVGLKPGRIRRQ